MSIEPPPNEEPDPPSSTDTAKPEEGRNVACCYICGQQLTGTVATGTTPAGAHYHEQCFRQQMGQEAQGPPQGPKTP